MRIRDLVVKSLLIIVIVAVLALVFAALQGCSCAKFAEGAPTAEATPTPAPTPTPFLGEKCQRVGDKWSNVLLCAVCDTRAGSTVYVVRGPDSVGVFAVANGCTQ